MATGHQLLWLVCSEEMLISGVEMSWLDVMVEFRMGCNSQNETDVVRCPSVKMAEKLLSFAAALL